MDGLTTALSEITLVLFTTLAPAGALAYVFMSIPLVFDIKADVKTDTKASNAETRQKLEQFLCVPILVAMIGLIASTTHLGNPANALYVVTGFGRSPLSNEVVSGAVFLGAAGVFWLTSFPEKKTHITIRRIVVAFISILGLVFIAFISFAYNAGTIITWNTPFTPISTWLNALSAGPILAILGLRFAHFYVPDHKIGRTFLIISAIAFIASVVVYALWANMLPSFKNSLSSGAELAPFFGPSIVVFALLGVSAIAVDIKAVKCEGSAPLGLPLVATILILAGIFIMRFQFYMIHLTVGI